MKKLIAVLLVFTMTGCATPPSDLGSSYVPVITYTVYDCEQLASEAVRINHRLTNLYTSLKKKADGDAAQMGIGLVLFWPILFALDGDGPQAAEYSRLKGEYEAVSQASIQKKCSLDRLPEIETPEKFKEETENS